MNKFLKISRKIAAIGIIFIGFMSILYEGKVDKKDYEDKNMNEVIVDFESKKSVNNGTVIRYKIYNNSKYKYILESAIMKFENRILDENGKKAYIYIEIEREENESNYKSCVYGIEPRKNGYMEFTIPKGVTLDEKCFNIDATSIEYTGSFMVDFPLLEGLRIPVEQNTGNWAVKAID